MKNVTGDALSIKAGSQKHPSIWRAPEISMRWWPLALTRKRFLG